MTVNVKGRSIEIDDKLAREYETLGQGSVNEDLILYELATFYKDQDEIILAQTMPEEELVNFIHACIQDYLRVIGGKKVSI